MEQIAGRHREKMKDLGSPAAKHRHREGFPVPGASHPSFPGLGTRKAGGKLGQHLAMVGTCPSVRRLHPAAGCSAMAQPREVMEEPQRGSSELLG